MFINGTLVEIRSNRWSRFTMHINGVFVGDGYDTEHDALQRAFAWGWI